MDKDLSCNLDDLTCIDSNCPMLDRGRVLGAFDEALRYLKGRCSNGCVHPHAVAVKAHALYCQGLPEKAKKPSAVTFKRYVSGRGSPRDVLDLLQSFGVVPASRVALCRATLMSAFREAVGQMEGRIRRGKARALHIADRAHEIYAQKTAECGVRPSRHTFRRLVFGKTADPQVIRLLEQLLLAG